MKEKHDIQKFLSFDFDYRLDTIDYQRLLRSHLLKHLNNFKGYITIRIISLETVLMRMFCSNYFTLY